MRRLLISISLLLASAAAFARDYNVTADGCAVELTQFRDISYASVPAGGRTAFRLSSSEEIVSCEISPVRRGVLADVKDGVASFTLPGRGWWVVRLNGDRRIFLFCEKVRKSPKGMLATDFATLQEALDAASGSGRTLVVPPGRYECGTLRIGSDTDVYLEEGALIVASGNPEDLPADEGYLEADKVHRPESYSDNGENMTFSRLILIEGENIRLRGRGTIDGNGTILRAQGKPSNLIRVRNSRNVLIEGLVLRNPAAWNTHILGSENVTVRGVKILNDPQVPNTDGIDPDSSERVRIRDCFAYCSDDNIAVKATNNSGILRNVSGISVKGCVFLTRKSSLKVGTETKAADMHGIVFANNDILECDRAFAIYCNDGADIHDVCFRRNRVERNWPDRQRRLVHFRISARNGAGHVHDIKLVRCSAMEPFPAASEIRGFDAGHPVSGVTFRRCRIVGEDLKTEYTNAVIRK